jgi:hypothetical protein
MGAKWKNFFNRDIEDGVRGQAVVQGASRPPHETTVWHNVKMWLDVHVEGWEPYRIEHHCMVRTSKHPQAGATLPVVVDRENKERIDIQWDQVKTVEELMSEGQPGQIPGAPNITMGQPQVIDLRDAGLSGDLNEQIQQAMQIAQQAMQQQDVPMTPPATGPAEVAQPPAGPSDPGENMVTKRLVQLEQLAALRDSGALTDAEFEAEKIKILSSD